MTCRGVLKSRGSSGWGVETIVGVEGSIETDLLGGGGGKGYIFDRGDGGSSGDKVGMVVGGGSDSDRR